MTRYSKFCLFVFLLIQLNLFGQKPTNLFKYEVEYVVNYTWKDKIENCLRSGADSLEIENRKKQISEFLKSKNASSKRIKYTWEYFYNGEKARIKGDKVFRGESFDIYVKKSNQRIIRRFRKGNENDLRVDTLFYNGKDKEYRIEIFKDSLKVINGFLCYLIKLDEINKKFSEEMTTHYEIYFTESIEFPINPIIQLPIQITDNCAVLIKSWVNEEKRNYMLYELVEYRPNIKGDLLKIPKKFKNK